jgi:hypothetical protein
MDVLQEHMVEEFISILYLQEWQELSILVSSMEMMHQMGKISTLRQIYLLLHHSPSLIQQTQNQTEFIITTKQRMIG